jgi:ABC-type polysaccharide/polyol phosphate transport system ATPase subunit
MIQPSVSFDRVSKRYRIGRTLPTLQSILQRRESSNQPDFHWALQDVSFNLESGQSLGIIGPNGAGKTTILKLLSRVTYPTEGQIAVNGRFSSLIELGAGFHPELTGRENIYLNGTILGMNRGEINKRFDQIVEFAGIGHYLDTPVKRYSSGMYARLGFAVAAHVDPEVLLVDEVLAVGDMAFRQKCYERMRKLQDGGTTLVFVSHDFDAVQKVCSRCLVMYRGQVSYSGPTPSAIAEYSNLLRKAAAQSNGKPGGRSGNLSEMAMTHGAVIEKVQLLNADGEPSLTFTAGEVVRVRVRVYFYEDTPSPVFACTVRQPDRSIVYNFTTYWSDVSTPDFPAETRAAIEYTLQLNLIDGIYHLGTDLAYSDFSRYYDRTDRAVDFTVTGGRGARGIANLYGDFRVIETTEAASAEADLQRL